jgi:hypothetical protein
MQNLSGRSVDTKDQPNKIPSSPLNTTNKTSGKAKATISDAEALKILMEVERLLNNSESLEAINLLRALKDNMQGVKSSNLHVLTTVNLGILYYQVGFLEEAKE